MILNSPEKKMKKNKEKKIAIDYNEIQYYRMYNGTWMD